MDYDREIRRKQNLLISSANAVMMFGLWSVARIMIMLVVNPDYFILDKSINIEEKKELAMIIMIVVALLIVIPDLMLRTYIVKKAKKEAIDATQGNIYIILSIIYLAISFIGDIGSLINITLEEFEDGSLSFIIVDLTSCVSMLLLVVSAISLRKLKKLNVKE